MRMVKRLKVDNRRTRILTQAEQAALLKVCRPKFGRMVQLALITGARFGELLALRWVDISDTEMVFLENEERQGASDPDRAVDSGVLDECPEAGSPWVFTNPRTGKPFTVNGMAHVFARALKRARIASDDVTLHTLRHTALSRMIASGYDRLHGDGDLRT
jgi:integrase